MIRRLICPLAILAAFVLVTPSSADDDTLTNDGVGIDSLTFGGGAFVANVPDIFGWGGVMDIVSSFTGGDQYMLMDDDTLTNTGTINELTFGGGA